MKIQRSSLLLLCALLVSIIPIVSGLEYFESDAVYFRANPNIDVIYTEDLYFESFEMDNSAILRVNDTVVLFNLTNLDTTTSAVSFNASGFQALYSFRWTDSDPYFTNTEGPLYFFTSTGYSSNQLNFTVNASATEYTLTRIYCGSSGNASNVAGATSWSYNVGTTILLANVTHSSPASVNVTWSGASPPSPDQTSVSTLIINYTLLGCSILGLGLIVMVASVVVSAKTEGSLIAVAGVISGGVALVLGIIIIGAFPTL